MSDVEYEVVDAIAYVRLNRPDKMNSLTLPMLSELRATAQRAAKDRSVRAVIISGNGENFCTGLDFGTVSKDFASVARTFIPNPLTGSNGFQDPAFAWQRVPAPVIAVIHGRCYGGGIQIALGADFRFVTPDSELSILEARWGLIPDMSISATIARLTNADTAKRLTMTGEMFSGTRAKELGLATEVSDDPFADAVAFARQLTERSPDAVAGAKKLFNTTWNRSPRWVFPVEQFTQAKLLAGKNFKIALNAGLKKVPPQFIDRR